MVYDAEACLRAAHPTSAKATVVSEQLSIVIVLLRVNAKQGEPDSVVAGGLEVMYSHAHFSGKAEITSNDGQQHGLITPGWVIDGVKGVLVVQTPF
jgi:hypothetical protein